LNSLYSSVSDGPHFVSDGGASTTIYPVIGTVTGTNQTVTSVTQQTIPSGVMVDNYNRHDQLKDFYSKSVSITLSIPILNGLQSNTAVQRAIVTNKLAKVTAEQTANTLRQSIETAYNDAFAASKTYASSVKQVNAREEAARMTKQRYEAGAANYTEYQVSENDLFQAKSDLTRAKYDFIFKKKLLDFYQGKPIQY
jgi:outer membrane protein